MDDSFTPPTGKTSPKGWVISFESLLTDMQHCFVRPDEHVLVLIGAVWTIDRGVIAAAAATAAAGDEVADEE